VLYAGTGSPTIVNGDDSNTAGTATGVTIAGGLGNSATANLSTIAGGENNTVTGFASSIVGGRGGKITGTNSVIGNGGYGNGFNCFNFLSTATPNPSDGQCFNEINANASFVGSGVFNVITSSAIESGIVGGSANRIAGAKGFIGGGVLNSIEQTDGAATPTANTSSVIVGGRNNIIRNSSAAIVAGTNNVASGNRSFVGAGSGNLASGDRSVIVGGGAEVAACWNRVTGLFDFACNNAAAGRRNFVGGGIQNTTSGNESVVAGGGGNEAIANLSFVGGGSANRASGDRSVVVGGGSFSISSCFNPATLLNDAPCQNNASGELSFVGGGLANNASGRQSTIVGGSSNVASAERAFVGGGVVNYATGLGGTVPGGRANTASGAYSFAAGRGAWTTSAATATDFPTATNYFGAFVWADTPDDGTGATPAATQLFRATANNQFSARARGGVVFNVNNVTVASSAADAGKCELLPGGSPSWSCTSDRNTKEAFAVISPRDVLNKVVSMPLMSWQYKGVQRRHLSPMAQDFWNAFGFGADDKSITSSDVSGVALAAVQGVNQKLNAEVAALKQKNDALARELAAIKKRLGM
jgi:trimeric autotransporter adhesin